MLDSRPLLLPPCGEPWPDGRGYGCGKPARWSKPEPNNGRLIFRCDDHREPFDVPIGSLRPIRRVRLLVLVELAGASPGRNLSHAEAVDRLERWVDAIGGRVLDLLRVTSDGGEDDQAPAPLHSRRRGIGR